MTYTAAVLTISDKGARGEREDKSGPVLCALAGEHDFDVVYTSIIPDEMEMIKAELMKCCDELGVSLVLTTGGTGFSPRDITPEATKLVMTLLRSLAASLDVSSAPDCSNMASIWSK